MEKTRWKIVGISIVIIAITVISLVLALPSSAETYSGNCGSNVKWSLDMDTGKLTISGTGAMGNYTFSNPAPWNQYRDSIRTVEIKDSVTSIGEWAFFLCSSLKSITIGNSVMSIGYAAFNGCGSLTSITIPNSVTSIGERAFDGCSSLTSVTIGSSVTSIGSDAFFDCSSLTSITIPDSVTSIGDGTFWGCNSLTSITVDAGNKKYHSNGNCLIETSSKTLIAGCNVSEIPKDGSVTRIGSRAFIGCSNLTSITIPDSVTWINHLAFSYCNRLTSITIPNSVTSIGQGVFYSCRSLTSITIPDSMTSIGSGAFSECSSLTSITIPDSVTSIGNSVFHSCTSLKKVIYCGTSTQWEQIAIGENNQQLTDIVQFHPSHTYDKVWSTDEAHHWHVCTVCGSASDKEAHVYASADDIDCDVCGRIKGDLNGDGVLDVRDVTALLSYLTDKNSGAITSSGDLTDDGKVTVKDVSRLLRYLAAK